MGIKITIPKDFGGELKKLPEDTYEAVLQDLFGGLSQAKKPKITVKWLIQSEYSGDHGKDYESTIGQNVLESYSLQENAMWKLNGLYKQVTGDNLPHKDFEMEELVEFLKDALKGQEFAIDVQDSEDGKRSQVGTVLYSPSRKSARKKR